MKIVVKIIQDALQTFWFVKFWMIYGSLILAGAGAIFYAIKMLIVKYRLEKRSKEC